MPDRRVPAQIRERLSAVRGFVFDMDGTLVLGDRRNHALRPLPGAIDVTERLGERGIPYVIVTNGTTRTPQEYAGTLREIGFDVEDDEVITPATSAVDVFARQGHRRVLVLGNEGLIHPLWAAGVEVVAPTGRPTADAVLVGWYPEFTMPALESACHAVWNGAALYSCSQSMFFATADGRALGTSRAISAMIMSLTECDVEIVGKPSLHALRCAADRLGVATAELAVVGDDPELEVPMAHRGASLAIAVSTGIGGAEAFTRVPEGSRPHLRLEGVDDLLSLLPPVMPPRR
ncbi:MAG TPA: HAD hydrolase-like protein [Streptosporangiaceae bacterium]|nr:HAD hydrolase-like protein [Streptosporangiaceae bacterium]